MVKLLGTQASWYCDCLDASENECPVLKAENAVIPRNELASLGSAIQEYTAVGVQCRGGSCWILRGIIRRGVGGGLGLVENMTEYNVRLCNIRLELHLGTIASVGRECES